MPFTKNSVGSGLCSPAPRFGWENSVHSGWASAGSCTCFTMLGDASPFHEKLISGSRIAHAFCDGGARESQNSDLLAPSSGIINQIKLYRPHFSLFHAPFFFLPPSFLSPSLLSLPIKQPLYFQQTLKKQRPGSKVPSLE